MNDDPGCLAYHPLPGNGREKTLWLGAQIPVVWLRAHLG